MNFFESAYEGTPPWDIGRPQREFVRLEKEGAILGSVLDVGCGTGENAIFLASRGHEVWGIDAAPSAIERARAKARGRRVAATFRVHGALALGTLGRTFDTVIDCGLFHTFDDGERPLFTGALTAVLEPGGTYHMMCFSEREPGQWGPRRVTQREIRSTFASGWRVDSIRPSEFETNFSRTGASAWLTTIRRETDEA